MKKSWILLVLLLPVTVMAQIGGRNVYDFLNLSPAARLASLGGVNITTFDQDQNFAYQNPALLNDSMSGRVALSLVNYLADIGYGYASYAQSFEGIGDFHAGIQYVGYGEMVAADQYGNVGNNFSSNDLAIVVGGARQVDNFRMGLNMKVINSSINGYQSKWGMGFDLGGLYVSNDRLFTAGMLFKHMGFNFSKYNLPNGQNANLPFEAQLGISYKLEHMPLRFSTTLVQINRPNLIYTDPDAPIEYDLSGEPIEPKSNVADNIFRHLVFGTEFVLSRNFHLRAGYNHQRRQELRSANRAGLAGFSFGGGIQILKFRFDYAYSNFHAVGGTHNFSLSTDIGHFSKKSSN